MAVIFLRLGIFGTFQLLGTIHSLDPPPLPPTPPHPTTHTHTHTHTHTSLPFLKGEKRILDTFPGRGNLKKFKKGLELWCRGRPS